MPPWKLVANCALTLLAASLATMILRNSIFEFCTTRAFGFPFPWYIEWCLCERDAPPVNLLYVGLNLSLVAAMSLPLALLVRRLRGGSAGR